MDNTEVWPRFEQLAETCSIKVDHAEDGWKVVVRQRAQDGMLVGRGDNLLAAVKDALSQAYAKGWHLDRV